MPDALEYLGVGDRDVDIWDPVCCNWTVYQMSNPMVLQVGEKYVLVRTANVRVRNIADEIRLCTDAGDEVFSDPGAKDFTVQYRRVLEDYLG